MAIRLDDFRALLQHAYGVSELTTSTVKAVPEQYRALTLPEVATVIGFVFTGDSQGRNPKFRTSDFKGNVAIATGNEGWGWYLNTKGNEISGLPREFHLLRVAENLPDEGRIKIRVDGWKSKVIRKE